MSEYCPDGWAIIEVTKDSGDKELFIFGSWGGGYLSGDYWRRNSGVERIESDSEAFYFYGYSGSVYKCYKASEGRISAYNSNVLEGILTANKATCITQEELLDNYTVVDKEVQ